jgi:protein-tyrosine-phosphatase
MAAEYLRHVAARSGMSHLVVDSAGLLGIEGAPAPAEARQVLWEAGLDLAGHRSRGIRKTDLRTSDIVIVMTLDHLEELERRFPDGTNRRYLIRAFEKGADPLGGAPELDDPIGQDLETYRRQFGIIRHCIDHLLLHLKHSS